MNLEMYLERREQQAKLAVQYREVCQTCFNPTVGCYCQWIRPVALDFQFVILIHPFEARRRIATGRLSHLCLPNSKLIRGHDFTENSTLNEILNDTSRHSLILYPGKNSANLSHMSEAGRASLCPPGKKLTVIVLDGTWSTAKKMLKHSRNLRDLPRICFTPDRPSNFRVRKQPREGYFSTIEAIHQTIDLLGPSFGFDSTSREHDRLLDAFNSMVELHLDFVKNSPTRGRASRMQASKAG